MTYFNKSEKNAKVSSPELQHQVMSMNKRYLILIEKFLKSINNSETEISE